MVKHGSISRDGYCHSMVKKSQKDRHLDKAYHSRKSTMCIQWKVSNEHIAWMGQS